jgi:hypothetical protein
MEQTARTPLRADGLRPLGLPRPIDVELTPTGLPHRLRAAPRPGLPMRAQRPMSRPGATSVPGVSGSTAGRRPISGQIFEVIDISEIWRIAEEWWRDTPIRRTYFQLVLDDGRPLTIFRDERTPSEGGADALGAWFEQRY